MEIKEMKEQMKELVGLLRQSEVRRKEMEKEMKLREQSVATALSTPPSVRLVFVFNFILLFLYFFLYYVYKRVVTFLLLQGNSLKHIADEMSGPLSPIPVPAQKQLKYTAGIANGSCRESAAFADQTRKVRCTLPLTFCVLHNALLAYTEFLLLSTDGAYGSAINEKISPCWTWWETVEMEEESSSMAITVQMEVAKTVETLGIN